MPRPSGSPFIGERLPLDDVGVLAGAPTLSGFADIYTCITYFDTAYANLGTGDSIVCIAARDGTYLESGDAVDFAWVVRCRGTATFDARDDADPDWTRSLPANDLGSQSVSSGSFAEVVIPTTSLTVDSVLAWDGQRLSITVTSGALDVDQVALQVMPPGGPLGGYGSVLPAGDVPVAPTLQDFLASGFGDDLVTGVPSDFDSSYSSALVNLLAETADPFTATAHHITGGELFGFVGDGNWSLRDYVQRVFVNLNAAIPHPTGTEGVDYWRRPDRTVYDLDAYFRFTAGDVTLAGWDNEAISVLRDVEQTGVGKFQVRRTGYADYEPPSGLNGDIVLEEDSSDPLATTDLIATTFPVAFGTLESEFALSFMSEWTQSNPGYFGSPPVISQPNFFLGVSDLETFFDPLTAIVHHPPYQVWVPSSPISWVQWRQRGDDLGLSTSRVRGHSTVQTSNRVRGIR